MKKDNHHTSSGFKKWIDSRFTPFKPKGSDQQIENPPAFDLVRA